jgi:cytochrome c5
MRIAFFVISFLLSDVYAAKPGKDTYAQYCYVCHSAGLAGAPKFQSKTDWLPRCEQKKLKGLLNNAMQGINAMPAKGTCDSCSQDDILEAIKYMVPSDEAKCHK